MTAITALTAQNTTGVAEIFEVTPAFLKRQIDMIFDDIRPDAVNARFKLAADAEINDPQIAVEAACKGRGWLISGGRPDTDRASAQYIL